MSRRHRPMHPTVKSLLLASFGLFGLLIAFVFMTGSTFGQRCHSAYPNDPLEAERCTDRVAQGGRF